ncbi:hypothetical protein QCA50_006504 [Cerrena zonata]|uniref:Uncharacterized protein n=1 Tax=Cerrena zonata TaxID=2478898 RepID=A0AAW0G8X1_9APHY
MSLDGLQRYPVKSFVFHCTKAPGAASQSGTERGRSPREKHASASKTSGGVPCVQPCASASAVFPTSFSSPSTLLSPPLTSPVKPADTDLGAIESDSTPRGDSSTLIRPGSEVEGEGDTARILSNLDSMPAPQAERSRRHRSSLTTNGSGSTVREAATIPRSASSRTPRKSILNSPSQKFNTQSSQPEAGPSTPERQLGLPSSTPRTPASRPKRSSSEPGLTSVLETPTNNKGKRKADDIEITPPDQKNGQRTTFALPVENTRRPHHQSDPSAAPSAYQRKRVRLSTTPSPAPSPGHSRPPTSQNVENQGSWSSRTSGPPPALSRAVSARAASTRSGSVQPSTPTSPSRPLNRSHSHHSPCPIADTPTSSSC